MTYLVFGLIAWASWVFAGQQRLFGPELLIGALLCWVNLFANHRARLASLVKDPVLYCGIVLNAVILVQTFYAGMFSYVAHESVWISAKISRIIPFSVFKAESVEMLYWFLPAFTIALMIRHVLRADQRKTLMRLCIINGGFLGAFSLANEWLRPQHMYFLIPQGIHFFGPFVYENSGGDYFLLLLCLTLAKPTPRTVRSWGRDIIILPRWFNYILPAFFFACVWFAACQTTRYMAMLALCLAVGFQLMRVLISTHPRFALLVPLPLTLIVLIWHDVARGLADRAWQWALIVRTWLHFPVWGVGGWGCRYFPSIYAGAGQQAAIVAQPINHCDPLEFLAEFGAVGFLCLVIPLVLMLWQRRARCLSLPVVGLFLVLVHSCIDCPFRCPAVLFLFIAILSCGRARPPGEPSSSPPFNSRSTHGRIYILDLLWLAITSIMFFASVFILATDRSGHRLPSPGPPLYGRSQPRTSRTSPAKLQKSVTAKLRKDLLYREFNAIENELQTAFEHASER